MAELLPFGIDSITGRKFTITSGDMLAASSGMTLNELSNSPIAANIPLTGTVSIDVTSLTGTIAVDVSTITGTVTVGRTPLSGTVDVGVIPLSGTITYGVDSTVTGTVSITAGMTNVQGVGTDFTNDFVVGEFIEITGEILEVSRLNSATDLDVSTPHVAGASGVTYTRRFDTVDIIGTGTDFTGELSPGDTIAFGGLIRIVDTITDATNLTVTNTIDGEDSDTGVSASLRENSDTVIGTGTLFLSELSPGDTVRIGEDTAVVGTITNDTTLVLENPIASHAGESILLIAATAAVIGDGTLFQSELDVGDFLEIGTSTIAIASITSDTELMLDSNHPDNSTGNTAIRHDNNVIGTGTLFLSEAAVGEVIRLANANHVITAINSDTDLEIGTPTSASVSGASTTSSSLTVVGVGTLFLTELSISDTISILGEALTVTSISDNTTLTVATPHSVGASGVQAFTLDEDATQGVVWIKDDVPNVLMFTNNQGTDYVVAGISLADFSSIAADSGTAFAGQQEDSLSIIGGDGISTSASGKVVTINSTNTTVFSPIGRLSTSIETITATTFSITSNDNTVTLFVDMSLNNVSINLPTAASLVGRIVIIKLTVANSNTLSVVPPGSETIDDTHTNASPLEITVANDSITVQSDGSNWWII